MIFALINLLLLFMLISIYVNEYKRIHSVFTLGFLIFVVTMFFRTFFSDTIIKLLFFDVRTASVLDEYRIFADISEFIALSVFLYFSTREEV